MISSFEMNSWGFLLDLTVYSRIFLSTLTDLVIEKVRDPILSLSQILSSVKAQDRRTSSMKLINSHLIPSTWTPLLIASSAPRCCIFYSYKSSRPFLTISISSAAPHKPPTRRFSQRHPSNMSYSNTDTGDKTADPYKAKNLDTPPLKEKIEGLVNFVASQKFGMLTTKIESSENLASRCMSVAATVCPP